MWTKTIKATFRREPIHVQVWLHDTTSDGKEKVRVQAMLNEYFLIEDIEFESRDAAYDFIRHYPLSMANAFIVRVGYESSAIA